MQAETSALDLVLGADPALMTIVGLSLTVSLVLIAIVVIVNALAWAARRAGERYAG